MRVKENNERNLVSFSKLKQGDCFRWSNSILIKTDVEQDAVDLADGVVYSNMCDDMVTPINAEVQIID